jgi:AcrR family transcriptional regulator
VAPRKTPDQPELGKQAAKSRRTQDAILNAVIDLINEGGFAAASSTQIARKAGVSWGAVQHHFGNKEEILEAVLERSHAAFAQRLGDERYTRVDRFVEAAWGHYQGNEYPAAMEILLATRARRGEGQGGIQFDHQAHLQLWRSVFHEVTLSDARMQEAIYTVHLMLTGILIQSLLEPAEFDVPRYLKRLKRIVLGMLME